METIYSVFGVVAAKDLCKSCKNYDHSDDECKINGIYLKIIHGDDAIVVRCCDYEEENDG